MSHLLVSGLVDKSAAQHREITDLKARIRRLKSDLNYIGSALAMIENDIDPTDLTELISDETIASAINRLWEAR